VDGINVLLGAPSGRDLHFAGTPCLGSCNILTLLEASDREESTLDPTYVSEKLICAAGFEKETSRPRTCCDQQIKLRQIRTNDEIKIM
jgi:hypothetical protein